jgi:hypothetical protein
MRFVVDKVALAQGFLWALRLFQYLSKNPPYPSSSKRCYEQKDKRAKPGNHLASSALSEICGHWIQYYVQFCFFFEVFKVCSDTAVRDTEGESGGQPTSQTKHVATAALTLFEVFLIPSKTTGV